MGLISGFIIFSLIVTLGYLVGILTFITDHEINECEMTYMYEYPQFVHIHVNVDHQFKKYGLYAYSEGRFTQNARNMKFYGIPVLFIPGNAGSFRQVRSFASVALRKTLDSRPGFHFDFFSVDLNDEFSGLNGALLNEQTEYVNHSIATIMKLYDDSKIKSKSIILLGHSMGGIIARAILMSLGDQSIIPLIITMAAPHSRPPLMLDSYMSDYYYKMHNHSHKSINSTIIALSGGYNDYIITPCITTSKIFDNLHVVTTSIPLVWLPIDHQCILWCKQLVLVLTRSLFGAVDLNTKQISINSKYLRAVFYQQLNKNNGIKIQKSIQSIHSTQYMNFGKGRGDWIENLQKQYTISRHKGVNQLEYHMIRILDEEDFQYLTLLALNLEVTEWVFACSAVHKQGQHRICSEGIHLSYLSEILPSKRYKRRILMIDVHELKKNYTDITHVVVRVLPTSEPMTLHVDRYLLKDRSIELKLPSFWSVQRDLILNETAEKIVHFELKLPQLYHVVQSYKLYVEPIKCNTKIHHATVSLIVPWGNQNIHKYIMESERNPLNVRLHQSRPSEWNDSFASVLLTLDPSCRYTISVRNNIPGTLGQIARIYTPLLLPNLAAVILLSFRNQMISIQTTGSCPMFFRAIQHGIKPYYILPLVKLASRGLSWNGFSNILPLPDWQIITEEGNDFLLLPLILYVTSVGIVWLVALGLASSLIFFESTFHKLASKFLARTVTGSLKLSDWVIGGFHKLPGIIASILVILSITTCGGLALWLGCIFYFLKLTQMSQDYVEQIVLQILKYFANKFKRATVPPDAMCNEEENVSSQNSISIEEKQDTEKLEDCVNENKNTDNNVDEDVEIVEETDEGNNTDENASENDDDKDVGEIKNEVATETIKRPNCSGIFFHFSIFMLWCIVAGLSVPSVLTWAHNFKYNTMLQPDPSFLPGFILSLCALPLWHMDLPKTNIWGYTHLGQLLNIMAAISLIYASVFVYRLNYVITATIALTTLHQMFAPTYVPDNTQMSDTDTQEPETVYNDVKVKWE